jgi:hypothetical protein
MYLGSATWRGLVICSSNAPRYPDLHRRLVDPAAAGMEVLILAPLTIDMRRISVRMLHWVAVSTRKSAACSADNSNLKRDTSRLGDRGRAKKTDLIISSTTTAKSQPTTFLISAQGAQMPIRNRLACLMPLLILLLIVMTAPTWAQSVILSDWGRHGRQCQLYDLAGRGPKSAMVAASMTRWSRRRGAGYVGPSSRRYPEHLHHRLHRTPPVELIHGILDSR